MKRLHQLTVSAIAAAACLTGSSAVAQDINTKLITFEANRVDSEQFINHNGYPINARFDDSVLGGPIEVIRGTYNPSAQTFTWGVGVAREFATQNYEAFTMIITGEGDVDDAAAAGEVVLIYFDMANPDGGWDRNGNRPRENTVSIYRANGQGHRTYERGELIASSRINPEILVKSINRGDKTSAYGEYTLDLAAVNDAYGGNWRGI